MKIFGKNTVLERMRANPRSIKKVYIEQGLGDTSYLSQKARKWGIPFLLIERNKMAKMARNINAQGVLAEVDDFEYVSFDDLVEKAKEKRLSLLFLDGLKDPQNLGAIFRSLACLGGFAVVLPKKESVEVTPTVSRVACGGENHVPVSKVSNLAQAIAKAKSCGFWIAGAVVKEGQDLGSVRLSFPLGVVIGSEEKGIRDVILKQIDLKLTIPMKQERLSLNAAQAAAIICYEITKQKNNKTPRNINVTSA